jgi:hypothetical protein
MQPHTAARIVVEAGLLSTLHQLSSPRVIYSQSWLYQVPATGPPGALVWGSLKNNGIAPTSWLRLTYLLAALDPLDAAGQLGKRLTHLEEEIRQQKQVLLHVTPRVGRLSLIELEYSVALRTAEHRWVKRIISELRSGQLSWNPEMLRKRAAHFLTG